MTGRRVWWLIFISVLVTHIPFFTLPAGIDSTWSVMAGAEMLAETNFDFMALLKSKGFIYGGPATHATSVVTIGTAIVLWALGPGNPALITLHLLHLAIGASGLWFYFNVSQKLLPLTWAIGSTIAVGLTPIVFTQFGMMYLETPLFTAVMASLWFFSEGRRIETTGFSLLAAAVKASGLAVAVTQVVVGVFERKHIRRTVSALVGGIAIVILAASQSDLPNPSAFDWTVVIGFWSSHWSFLRATPLTLGLLIAYLAATASIWRSRRDRPSLLIWTTTFPLVFVGGHLVGPLIGQGTNLLPRYWVVAIPAMILTVSFWLTSGQSVLPPVATGGLYLGVAILGLLGFLLPTANAADFVLAERAPTARHLFLLEKQAIQLMQESDATMLVTLDTAFRLTTPAAGYVTAIDRDFEIVRNSDPFTDVPGHIIFLQRHNGPAQNTIEVEQLGDGWDVDVTPLRRGPFLITVVEAFREP